MRHSSHTRPHPGARRAPCRYEPRTQPPPPPSAAGPADDGDGRGGFWAALRETLEGSAGR